MKRIITANVNGIRAAERKGFFDWMKTQNADVVCVQEIKAQEDQLDDKFYPKGIHTYYKPAERKGYSGTGLYCKDKPDRVIFSPWEDIDFEGRFIQADFRNLSVISIYIPSGSSKQERQDYKMNFMIERFMPYLKKLQEDGRQYIVCGDINIVHKEIDIKNFASNKNRSGCLPEERAWMEQLFTEAKFIDAFRELIKKNINTLGGQIVVKLGRIIRVGALTIKFLVLTSRTRHNELKFIKMSAFLTTLRLSLTTIYEHCS